MTTIEWTEETWNPTRGCSKVSDGCRFCYAMKQAHRMSGVGKPYHGLTKQTKAGPQWTGRVVLDEPTLRKPLSWKRPRRVFVNSMSDLFHESLPDDYIDSVFAVMALCQQHTFQVLTKRADRMRSYLADTGDADRVGIRIARQVDLLTRDGWPWVHGVRQEQDFSDHADSVAEKTWRMQDPFVLPNVWLGVSVEDQPRADVRIPQLLQTPAAVRFISAEPLLGPVDLNGYLPFQVETGPFRWKRGLDWVIVGGESGPGARPFDVSWARSIVRQCKEAGIACFVKQLGSDPRDAAAERDDMCARELWPDGWMLRLEGRRVWRPDVTDRKGGDPAEWPADLCVREFPR